MNPINIPVHLTESDGIKRSAEPVTMGVPVPKGTLFSVDNMYLQDKTNICPVEINPMARWPDGSFKWLLLKFFIDLPAGESKTLYLKEGESATELKTSLIQGIRFEQKVDHILLNTGTAEFKIPLTQLSTPLCRRLEQPEHQNQIVEYSTFVCIDRHNKQLEHRIDEINIKQADNTLSLTIELKGRFEKGQDVPPLPLKFYSKMTFYAQQTRIKWQLVIHNPNRARHEQGFWDLGDPGSICFKELSIKVPCTPEKDTGINWKPAQNQAWQAIDVQDWELFQASSGGNNWQSSNHVNSLNQVNLPFRGARFKNTQGEDEYLDRVSPFIFIQRTNMPMVLHIRHFWQNFPKAISVKENTLELALFPKQSGGVFELQGGEKKTHTLYINYSDQADSLDYCVAPLIPVIPLEYYARCHVMPLLPEQYQQTELDGLIQTAVEGENNFFHKREIIDEYGWRHFGDLFADHESLYNKEGHYFISHYNNQYDALSGFIRQFILTGNRQWFSLLSELAEHIADIDIYDTELDRMEYNHGLFWHTNHYVDALTSTHRTFSKGHITEAEPNPGGGPGNEHCYSRGLMQHYFLTGAEASRTASLKMTRWMIKLHEGNNGVLERLLKFVQNDLPVIRQKLKGNQQNFYRYPLNRGTGNYINSLLDAFELTSDKAYLQKAAQVIYQTLHPEDGITDRELDDLEPQARWSYTIVLQALIAYLRIKSECDELDESFYYARDCLKHYTLWMLDNEYPYLDKPEILEFPNDTWTAQDLRKAYIFAVAAQFFEPPKQQQCLDKAEFFMTHVVKKLNQTETRTFTRIQVILMQNHLDLSNINLFATSEQKKQAKNRYVQHKPLQNQSVAQMLNCFTFDIFKRLCRLSIKREYQWIKTRFL